MDRGQRALGRSTRPSSAVIHRVRPIVTLWFDPRSAALRDMTPWFRAVTRSAAPVPRRPWPSRPPAPLSDRGFIRHAAAARAARCDTATAPVAYRRLWSASHASVGSCRRVLDRIRPEPKSPRGRQDPPGRARRSGNRRRRTSVYRTNSPARPARSSSGCGRMPKISVASAAIPATVVAAGGPATTGGSAGGSVKNINTITRT